MMSISKTRRVLAVVVVTAALCADQAAVASSLARPQANEFAQIASRMVVRLARNFQRVMPSTIREPARHQRLADPVLLIIQRSVRPASAHTPVSPFQFRLPPPLPQAI